MDNLTCEITVESVEGFWVGGYLALDGEYYWIIDIPDSETIVIALYEEAESLH